MPIRLDPDESPRVEPETDDHRLLEVLAEHPDVGFAPRELAELADVPESNVRETLSGLADRGLVRQVDSYWAIADDVAASRLGTLVSRSVIEDIYGDDAYGADDEWVDDLPDLGENA